MKPELTPDRVEFATTIFFRECIRQYIKMYPGKYSAGEMPIQPLATYSPAHQRAMCEAVRVAVEAATGMDDLFATFLRQKQELRQANAGSQ